MATQLDTFLKTLRGAGEDTATAGQTLRGLRQQQDLRQFAGDLPGILAQEDFSQIAGRALEAGLPTITQGIIGNQMDLQQLKAKQNLQKKEDMPLDELLIKQAEQTYGVTIPRDKPGSVQKQLIEQADKARAFGLKQSEFGLQRKEADRRVQDAAQKARVDFTKDVQSKYGKKLDVLDKISNIEQMGVETPANQRLLMTTLAKAIGGEGGVLTDRDIADLVPPTIGRTVNELKNYVTNNAEQTLPPEVAQSLLGVLKKSKQNFIEANQVRAKKDLKSAIEARRDRIVSGGTVDPTVLTEAAKFGLGVKVAKNGEVIVDTFENLTEKTGKKISTTLPLGDGQGLSVSDFKTGSFQGVATKIINNASLSAEQKQEKLKELKAKEK